MNSGTKRGWVASIVLAMALLATACGGGSSGSDDATTAGTSDGTDATADSSADDATGAAAAPEPTEPPVEEESASFEPGPIEYRAVNLLDRPVDIYVRTTGLVEAMFVMALASGAVSDFVAPPDRGVFLVTEADAGDPTCVSGCDHFVTSLSAFPEEGPYRTVVLYEDDFSGTTGFELWEQPTADRQANSNSMTPAQAGRKLITVTAVAVTDADFGLRISTDLSGGCLEPVNLENILIGGNQTPAFSMGEASSFSIHANDDRECAAPVDGPFPFSADADSRTHVILSGSPGSLQVIQLPMTVGEVVEPPAGSGGDRDAVVALLAEDAVLTFGIPEDQATCLGGLIVDAVGADVIFVDGELVELDFLPAEAAERVGAAIVSSPDACGIDPAVFGG
ncbi:MAG: hypothetical protein AAF567_03620 [Actinomycetota bacterium]